MGRQFIFLIVFFFLPSAVTFSCIVLYYFGLNIHAFKYAFCWEFVGNLEVQYKVRVSTRL